MSRLTLRRFFIGFAYRQVPMRVAYASVTIVVMIGFYVLFWLWQVKSLGVTIDWTGELQSVHPGTLAAQAGLHPGDYITFDDFQRLKSISAQARVGQLVEVAVRQHGEWRDVTLQAIPNSPQRLLSLSVEPLVGILFAILGVAPLVARRRGSSLWLFLIASQVTALFLITDVPRAYHQLWAEVVAYITFPLFPAVVFQFHTVFPKARLGRMRKRVVILVYLIAAVILPINLISVWNYAFHVSDEWQWIISVYEGAALAASAGLVIRTFAITRDPKIRSQLKIITTCLSIGLLVPAVVVVLMMMFDLDTSDMLKSATIFIGLIVPAGYAYSMGRYNLLIGGLLWRPSLIKVVYTSVLSLGLIAFVVFIFPGSLVLSGNSSFIAWVVIVLLVVTLAGAHEWLGRWTETHLFKGGNYIDLLASATDELARFHHLAEFVRFFTEMFPARLKSVGSLVFLIEGSDGPVTLQACSSLLHLPVPQTDIPSLQPDSELREMMESVNGPVSLSTLLMPHASQFCASDYSLLEVLRAVRIEWLLPLVSSQRPQLIGLVALGAKETDESYSGQEITALTALARTASISAENVLMFEALQKRVTELDQEREFSASLARDLGAAQELERTRISSEIHDTVLQELGVGLRLLARLRDSLQQALGRLEDSEIALERLGDLTSADLQNSVGVSARRQIQSILNECQSTLATLLGEGILDDRGLGLMVKDVDVQSTRSDLLVGPLDYVDGKHLVDDILSLVRSTNDRLREICTDLHPAYLDAPLAKTLSRSIHRLGRVYPAVHMEIRVNGLEPATLADTIKDVCKKITDQAIHNALNHAQPSSIEVEMTFTNTISGSNGAHAGATLMLSIADDGVGFAPRTPGYWRSTRHHGLANMYESSALIGGHLQIDSTPRRGTRVNLRVSLDASSSY